jgi:hypothetical protein
MMDTAANANAHHKRIAFQRSLRFPDDLLAIDFYFSFFPFPFALRTFALAARPLSWGARATRWALVIRFAAILPPCAPSWRVTVDEPLNQWTHTVISLPHPPQ